MTEIFEAKISVEFVLNVLRQHEIELDRLIAELEPLVKKVDELTNKMQQIMSDSSSAKTAN